MIGTLIFRALVLLLLLGAPALLVYQVLRLEAWELLFFVAMFGAGYAMGKWI